MVNFLVENHLYTKKEKEGKAFHSHQKGFITYTMYLEKAAL